MTKILIGLMLAASLACGGGSDGHSVAPATATCLDFDGDGPPMSVPAPVKVGGSLRLCFAVKIRVLAGGRICRRMKGCYYDCPEPCIKAPADDLCVVGEDDEG